MEAAAAGRGVAAMDELIPVVLGAAFGALIRRGGDRRARIGLAVLAVAASGAVATIRSGEYEDSWLYLLLDAGEAAAGLIAGLALAHHLRRPGGASGPSSPTGA